MPLTASCDGVYFTNPPKDNLITLTWENDATTPFIPYSFVIFKVKCTTPHMFHIHPCFGAILLSESSDTSSTNTLNNGISKQQGVNIVIGLQDSYLPHGHNVYGDEAVSRQTASLSSTKKRLQEHFVIESLIVTQDMMAFQQSVDSLHDTIRLSHTVKRLWSLISSNEIPRSHTRPCNAINLKVYMKNVVMHDAGFIKPGGDVTKAVVVPKSAVLIPPSLTWQAKSQTSPSSSNNYSTVLVNHSEGMQGANISSHTPMKDELRALKNEIALLRKIKAHDASLSTSNVKRGSSTDGKNTSAPNGFGNLNSSSTEAFPQFSNIIGSKGKIHSDKENINTLTSTSLPVDDEQNGTTGHRGLKLYILLGVMFFVYFLGLFMQRSRVGI
ncbi:unnamed protein product [Phytomonas sp. EM1]|nr:unnamed protein product [Phytomonas sp. EM1]|eukprot:CCW61340.1 unnamed protein product [Phytomonas sp. isolate EM1]